MDMNVRITDFGASPDGTLCTRAIQAAIDECFLQGGGTVEVPAGEYLTGGIRLRSNITLLLRAGACLKGVRDPEAYMGILTDELQPLRQEYRTDRHWEPARVIEPDPDHPMYAFMQRPGGRWCNGLIRAVEASHVAIIGEEGSVIDGSDCYDPLGEEFYRGPHGISMHHCRDVRCQGYVIRNTGNWAHAFFECQDVCLEGVTALAGHDGVHLTSCDQTVVRGCAFYTGDDCVAGINNTHVLVENCVLNTACSAFRFGGRHVRIRDCQICGPAKYLFRGSLSLEEKRDGKVSQGGGHRYNMLSAFTYYADFTRHIAEQPGDILMERCTVRGADRFVHYNYSGNEEWQRNRPLAQIAFRDVRVEGLKLPLTLYGDAQTPLQCRFEDCRFSFSPDAEGTPFMHLCHYDRVELKNVKVEGLKDAPLIRRWSRTEGIILEQVDYPAHAGPAIEEATEPFRCAAI